MNKPVLTGINTQSEIHTYIVHEQTCVNWNKHPVWNPHLHCAWCYSSVWWWKASPKLWPAEQKLAQIQFEDVPLVEFMYLVFTCMPGESYCRWFRSLLLYLCYVVWVLINSLVCWLKTWDRTNAGHYIQIWKNLSDVTGTGTWTETDACVVLGV